MKLKFSKMHGLGNDFMVIDGVSQSFHAASESVALWEIGNVGVGFDKIVVIEKA